MRHLVSQTWRIASFCFVFFLLLDSCSAGKQKYPDGVCQLGSKSYQGGSLAAWQNETRPWLIDRLKLTQDLSLLEKRKPPTFKFTANKEQGIVVLKNSARLYHVSYPSFDGRELFGYLLVPVRSEAPKQKKPTLIVLHGHSKTKEDVVFDPQGTFKSVVRTAIDRGFVVFVPDQRTFGENEESVSHYPWVEKTLQEGRFMSTQILDVMMAQRAIEALDLRTVRLQGLVGTEHNGLMGLSLGGYVALLAGAIETRFEFVNVQGHFFPFEYLFSSYHCACQRIPSLAGQINISDLALLVVPRKLRVGIGLNDPYVTGFVTSALEVFKKQAVVAGVQICDGLEKSSEKICPIVLEIDKDAEHEFLNSDVD